ncbi:MAG TPA: cupredoxin domain-containing protein [Thermoanaerobaculia bacterium]|nr:cupredoxin domain-containing protein [Thermoanaerobaculia bacterium]
MSLAIANDPLILLPTLLGMAAAIFAGWYFFAPGARSAERHQTDVQEIVMTIEHGFSPETIVVRCGTPVKLRVVRPAGAPETAELFLPWFHLHRKLPGGRTTTIDLEADEPGAYPFHSTHRRLEGYLVAVPRD